LDGVARRGRRHVDDDEDGRIANDEADDIINDDTDRTASMRIRRIFLDG
jgi:hypothetical protein